MKGGDPTIKGAFYCGVHTLRDPSGYPSGGSPLIGYCFARSQLAFSFASVRTRTHTQRDSFSNGEHSHYQLSYSSVGSESAAQLVVRVLSIAIRVPLRMGSSSHGGERKGQLGPGETLPMSGLPLEGYPEGSRRVWTPQYY